MNKTPEQIARDAIDDQLVYFGWVVQERAQLIHLKNNPSSSPKSKSVFLFVTSWKRALPRAWYRPRRYGRVF